MEILCEEYRKEIAKEEVDPLVLIGAFILDFRCIHPLNDGNGRFISLEKIIEDSKETYYEALNKSSMLWHDGKIICKYGLSVFLELL